MLDANANTCWLPDSEEEHIPRWHPPHPFLKGKSRWKCGARVTQTRLTFLTYQRNETLWEWTRSHSVIRDSFLNVFICLSCLCLCVCMWRSKDTLQKSVLSLHPVGLWDQTQVVRLDSNAFTHWTISLVTWTIVLKSDPLSHQYDGRLYIVVFKIVFLCSLGCSFRLEGSLNSETRLFLPPKFLFLN